MPQPSDRYHVVVVGAGLVGASLALGLSRQDLEVALVDVAPPAPLPEWDSRVYALNPASVDFLDELNVWQSIEPARRAPVHAMRIFGDAEGARLDFSAYDCGVAELAWIVESARLQTGLWRLLESERRVTLFCPARCERLLAGENGVVLAGGKVLRAQLLVAADGGQSWLRQAAGIEAEAHAYGQLGVVANFECETLHRGTAYQWFREDGVLAWLPLPGPRMSMVWSTPEPHARHLLSLAPEALAAHVAEAGSRALGRLRLLTAPAAFPLMRLSARELIRPGLALVGDAAHVVHPLAGQGVNLGFADAKALSRVLAAREPFRPCGDARLLRRYERERAGAILAVRWTTDGLARLFGSPAKPLAWLRNRGLNLTDGLPVIKTLLARHALG